MTADQTGYYDGITVVGVMGRNFSKVVGKKSGQMMGFDWDLTEAVMESDQMTNTAGL